MRAGLAHARLTEGEAAWSAANGRWQSWLSPGPISRRNQQIGDCAAAWNRPNVGPAAAGRKEILIETGLRRLTERTQRIWSGRFQSCAFDRPQLWAAIRFLESRSAPYSSRNTHHSGEDPDRLLDMALWDEVYGPARWTRFAGLTDPAFEAALTVGIGSGQPLLETVHARAAAR